MRSALIVLPLLFQFSCASALAYDEPAQAEAEDDAEAGPGLCLLQGLPARARGAALGLGALGARGARQRREAPALCSADGALAASVALTHRPYFWANKNGDAACSGASQFAGPFNVSAGPAWSFKDETASIVSSHPCIDEHKAVYLAHRNGKLRKFSPEGELLWTNAENYEHGQAGQPMVGSPVLHNGAVYVGTLEGYVTAVDMASGETRWRKRLARSASADSWSLQALAGVVLAPMRRDDFVKGDPDIGGNDRIVAVDASDGRVLWRWAVPDGQVVYNWIGSLADDPPSVLFSTAQGRPYRLRLCDGSVVWEGPDLSGGDVVWGTGGLVVGPTGLAYVTSNFHDEGGAVVGRLAAYNVTTGALAWSRPQPTSANNAPAVGRLAAGPGPPGPLAVVVGLGENPGTPRLAGADPAYRSELVAFDAASGQPTGWRFSPPARAEPLGEGDAAPDRLCLPDAWSNAAVDGLGAVYVGHMSGRVYALRDADGDGRLDEAAGEVVSYYGGRCYQGSPGIAPGMLVTTPCDGMHVFSSP